MDSSKDIRELNHLAEKLRGLYALAWRKREAFSPKNPYNYDKVWMSAAETIKNIGADPVLYVDAQFILMSGKKKGVMPTDLLGEDAIDRYKKMIARGTTPYEAEMNNQIFYLKSLLKANQNKEPDDILMDEHMPIKAFIRMMLCSEDALGFIGKKFRNSAILELEFDPGVKELIKNKYGTRYKRIYPERVSTRPIVQYFEDPGPPEENTKTRNYARRPKRYSQQDNF